jgi:hypothetical protein
MYGRGTLSRGLRTDLTFLADGDAADESTRDPEYLHEDRTSGV